MKTIVELTREAGGFEPTPEFLERLVELARADERMSFYGQDKPVECAEGCPPNQICDYCQVVAPVKAMILAEREACANLLDSTDLSAMSADPKLQNWTAALLFQYAAAIRARGEIK